MQRLPHEYLVTVTGETEGDLDVRSTGLPAIASAPPVEFGGPGGRWSPETLLVGAVADCYVLTFRAAARALELPWLSLRCSVRGTLDRQDGVVQFTAFHLRAELTVRADASADLARRALEKGERGCLIANSLKAPVHLDVVIDVPATPQLA
jgi:organic hydroperoxide reductase OsmC/OhrA